MQTTLPLRLDNLRYEAARLGIDHALAMASWVDMSEDDARSVLDDVDPRVLDQWSWPNLSGEWADDWTPDTLLSELGVDVDDLPSDAVALVTDEVCGAWQDAADATYVTALEAVALRTLGRIDEALTIESALERRARS